MNEELDYLICNYGYLLPRHKEILGEKFGEIIEENYDLSEPRNRAMFDFAKNSGLVFLATWQGISVRNQ